jgi:hypothetical protein
MHRYHSPGTTCSDVSTDGRDRRGLVRAGLAVGAGLLLAALGLGMAAQAAHATTFPGTNGRIAGSGSLNTTSLASQLELFTKRSQYSDPAGSPGDECRLTFNTHSDFNPRYSKDGKKIVYVQNGNLWTMQLDAQGRCAIPGSELPLTAGATDSFFGGWCTKPNGEEWVVFQRNTVALSFEVYKVQVDPATRLPKGPEIPLTLNTANDSQPAVTPDCSKIAFHSNRGTPAESDVWVMGFEPNDPTTPSDDPINRTDGCPLEPKQQSAPSWSPGKLTTQGGTGTEYRITFQTNRDPSTHTSGGVNFEIYRIDDVDANSDGCGDTLKRLSYSEPFGVSFDVTGYDLNPVYSPDGARICFHSGRNPNPDYRNTGAPGIDGQWDLYTLDAVNGEYHASLNTGGTATEQLTDRAGNDERCGWQEKPGA